MITSRSVKKGDKKHATKSILSSQPLLTNIADATYKMVSLSKEKVKAGESADGMSDKQQHAERGDRKTFSQTSSSSRFLR
jgi:hypothetical protein